MIAVSSAQASSKSKYVHAQDVLRFFRNHPRLARSHKGERLVRSYTKYVRWVKSKTPSTNYWINRQITVATMIARASSGDPWPNCPDPYDGSGASWYDTVQCENGGNWYDSPGYYRCGLQFDPGWETKYGRLCP